MLFHHIVNAGLPVYPPLDTLGAIFYAAFFIAVTLITMRRPAYGACVLVAAVPFALYQEALSTTIRLPKVAVIAVLLGLCAYRDAFAPLAARAPWRILSAGVLVLCATLLSFAHAAHHAPVIREALKLVEYLLIFVAAFAAFRLDPDRTAIRIAVLGTAIAVAVAALAQELIGAPSGLWIGGHIVPRIAGPLEGPNQLAGYMDVALPLTMALAIDRPNWLAKAALALCAWADVLTFSRGGLIAGAIGVLIVLFVQRRNIRATLTPLLAGALAGIGVDLAWAASIHAGAGAAFRLNEASTDYAGDVGTRGELWRAAITLWKRHPIFGVGAGNFEFDIPQTGLKGVHTHANSLYLQALVEGGIPLIAATLWLVYTSIATFVRERMESPFVLAALAASTALALHQIVDFLTFYPKIGGEWWVVMALGAAELAAYARVQQQACA